MGGAGAGAGTGPRGAKPSKAKRRRLAALEDSLGGGGGQGKGKGKGKGRGGGKKPAAVGWTPPGKRPRDALGLAGLLPPAGRPPKRPQPAPPPLRGPVRGSAAQGRRPAAAGEPGRPPGPGVVRDLGGRDVAVYEELDRALLAPALEASLGEGPGEGKDFVEGMLEGLMRSGGRDFATAGAAKVRDKVILLDNPHQSMTLREAHAKQAQLQKKALRPIPARALRRHGVHDLMAVDLDYRQLLALHEAWRAYAAEAMAATATLKDALRALDLHGSIVEVQRSWTPHHVGVRGIVVQDTKQTFVVVTEANRKVRVLKRGTALTCNLAAGVTVTIVP